jgi:predicted phosphodiesterase
MSDLALSVQGPTFEDGVKLYAVAPTGSDGEKWVMMAAPSIAAVPTVPGRELALRCSVITSTRYEITSEPFRALLVSDFHLAKSLPFERSAAAVLAALTDVAAREAVTAVFVLGDVIHSQRDPANYIPFYHSLESLGIEVNVIPGNHDRRKHPAIVARHKGRNVRLCTADVILLVSQNRTRAVALGHDLRNDLGVRTEDFVAKWLALLRTSFSDHIPGDALVVLGHVHAFNTAEGGMSYTIPPFSEDMHVFQYGVLERDANGVLGLRIGER